MENEKCYRFTPGLGRPSKRRKIDKKLIEEPRRLREQDFEEFWSQRHAQIKTVLEGTHQAVYDSIVDFLDGQIERPNRVKIPTALIITGPSIASSSPMLEYLQARLNDAQSNGTVSLRADECPNLKTFLKSLITKFTRTLDPDDDEAPTSMRKAPRRLNYDLEILHDWYQQTNLSRLVVIIQQTETFDPSVMAEAIELFQSWLDRLPLVLVFDIGTSVEFFHERLPRTAIRCLEGQKFDVTQAEVILEQVFRTTTRDIPVETALWPGASLCDLLLDWHKQHTRTVESYTDALKYAYMSHFFANPLSIILSPGYEVEQVHEDLAQAIRNLPSFRHYVEKLLDEDMHALVSDLLNSNATLAQFVQDEIMLSRASMKQLVQAVDVIYAMRTQLSMTPIIPWPDIYVRAMAGNLIGTPLVRDLLLTIRKAPSDVLIDVLEAAFNFADISTDNDAMAIKSAYEALQDVVKRADEDQGPLRSSHDVRGDTLRATVVAQKVQLSKQKSQLSKHDLEYSEAVDRLHSSLNSYFEQCLIDPKDLFLNEVLIYDLRSPHREVFIPRPRQAFERALSAPQDYLTCDCCPPSEGNPEDAAAIAATQNPTTILYQLYLESGSLINSTDLWTAFNDILSETNDEKTNMALFDRALAELRFTGCVKGSRRKQDHVSKLLWKGL